MIVILYTKEENGIIRFLDFMKTTYNIIPPIITVDWANTIDDSDITTCFDVGNTLPTREEFEKFINIKYIVIETDKVVKIKFYYENPVLIDKTTVQADGIDTVTFSNVPLGTITISNSESVSGSIEGTDTFATTIAGTYHVTIVCDGYEDFTTTIEAI